MIHRFFSLLLVPMMLINQGISLGHAHRAAGDVEPDGQASRPHFHLGGQGHHGSHPHGAHHSHGHHADCGHASADQGDGRGPSVVPAAEHDDHAVYCSATVASTRGGRALNVDSSRCSVVLAILPVASSSNLLLLHLGPVRGQPTSVFDADCPIYLRTLSLRI